MTRQVARVERQALGEDRAGETGADDEVIPSHGRPETGPFRQAQGALSRSKGSGDRKDGEAAGKRRPE